MRLHQGFIRSAGVAVMGAMAGVAGADDAPRHFVFFGFDRELIQDDAFLESEVFDGAQLKYSWRELEREKGAYDFGDIRNDLKTLSDAGKALWIQVQDSSFDHRRVLVPDYVQTEPEYTGGAALQYFFDDEQDSNPEVDGWVARRWDPAVQARFHLLLAKLGEEFDGKLAGVNLAETAVGFGVTGAYHPQGFTFNRYREAIIETMAHFKRAFPTTPTVIYANFMPGDVDIPPKNLQAVYAAAKAFGVGVGGPDIKVNKYWQMQNSYPLIREASGTVPTAVAVQWGNYEETDPKTKKQVSVEDIYTFANEYLKADYIFWCTQPPYFEEGVKPFLRQLATK